MKLMCGLFIFGLLSTATSWAGTVYVGFDDAVALDYDYQDLVFSISGTGLQINSQTGSWVSTIPTLTSAGNTPANGGLQNLPYWNQTSSDGANYNIGYCIWGGGDCNNGAALSPQASYFTNLNDPLGSVNDVTFSVAGTIAADITLHIAGGNDILGWYNATDPSTVHWLNSASNMLTTSTFTPAGAFGLVGENLSLGFTFYTQTNVPGNDADTVAHFAYFAQQTGGTTNFSSVATPEPAAGLLGLTAILLLASRRRKSI